MASNKVPDLEAQLAEARADADRERCERVQLEETDNTENSALTTQLAEAEQRAEYWLKQEQKRGEKLKATKVQLAEARAEVDRLTDRLTEQVANGDGWRTGQAAAENRCHALSTSLSEARALLARIDQRGGCGHDVHGWIDDWQRANPESPRAAGKDIDDNQREVCMVRPMGGGVLGPQAAGAVRVSAADVVGDTAAVEPPRAAAEDEDTLCSECNEPVQWGSRHAECGRKAMAAEPRAAAERAVLEAAEAFARSWERAGAEPGDDDLGEEHVLFHAVLALRSVEPISRAEPPGVPRATFKVGVDGLARAQSCPEPPSGAEKLSENK